MTTWRKVFQVEPEAGQRCLIVSGPRAAPTVADYWQHCPGVHDSDTGFFDDNGDEVFPVFAWAPCPAGPDL